MTAQITDAVKYNQDKYQLIGLKGSGLPTPLDFDMQPTMMSTGCYRGYFMEYKVQDSQLVLSAMTIRARDEHYKPIGGVEPEIGGTFRAGQYFGLSEPTHFSGGLLLAKDFINSMYVHMGFQKPTSFEKVVELLIDDGRMTQVIDHSEKVAALREEMLKPQPKPGYDDPAVREKQLQNWITWTFSLDYDL